MDTVIAALVVMSLLLFGGLGLAYQYLNTQETLLFAWQAMERRFEEHAHTDLAALGAETQSGGTVVEVTMRNEGEVKLADFSQWDVIVQYQASGGSVVNWLPYEEGLPAGNEWSVSGIYVDAETLTAEAYDPDLLNPDEELVLTLRLQPAVQSGSVNRVVVVTPAGIGATSVFTR